ncbi:unnamed protein product [Mycena citricolor]|uniref:Uncharacterized protein n=1 Tax=Mycena citricolor TaxID=2018698 RepID=A0AAD2K0T9_9AGAR|nr:unnamed protein product [Mycena citricolor]
MQSPAILPSFAPESWIVLFVALGLFCELLIGPCRAPSLLTDIWTRLIASESQPRIDIAVPEYATRHRLSEEQRAATRTLAAARKKLAESIEKMEPPLPVGVRVRECEVAAVLAPRSHLFEEDWEVPAVFSPAARRVGASRFQQTTDAASSLPEKGMVHRLISPQKSSSSRLDTTPIPTRHILNGTPDASEFRTTPGPSASAAADFSNISSRQLAASPPAFSHIARTTPLPVPIDRSKVSGGISMKVAQRIREESSKEDKENFQFRIVNRS